MSKRSTLAGLALPLGVAVLLAGAMACNEAVWSGQAADRSLLAGQAYDLSGTWALNREASDPPPRALRGSGDGVRLPRWPDGVREDRGFENRSDSARTGRPMLRRGVEELQITQSAESVTFTSGHGHSRTFYTDGRVMAPDRDRLRQGAAADIEIRATWIEAGLQIEHGREGRAFLTEVYAVSRDGSRLSVDTTIDSDNLEEPLRFRRIYDRVEGE